MGCSATALLGSYFPHLDGMSCASFSKMTCFMVSSPKFLILNGMSCVTTSLRESRLWPPHTKQTRGDPQVAPIRPHEDQDWEVSWCDRGGCASFNTPRVCIPKSRHMQGLREQGDKSVEDKLEESQVGPQAITLEVGVLIWVSTLSLYIWNMKAHQIWCQSDTQWTMHEVVCSFAKMTSTREGLEMPKKCTIGGGMVSAVHNPGLVA